MTSFRSCKEDDFTPISLPVSSRTLANNASPRHPYDWPSLKRDIRKLLIEQAAVCPQWNYTLRPRVAALSASRSGISQVSSQQTSCASGSGCMSHARAGFASERQKEGLVHESRSVDFPEQNAARIISREQVLPTWSPGDCVDLEVCIHISLGSRI